MTSTTDPIADVLKRYQAAVYAKDVDALVALYDTHVQVFDMWSEWCHSGIDAWRAKAQGWLGTLGTDKVVVDVHDAQSQVADTLACGHAYLTFTAVSPSGEKLRSLTNRLTVVLRRGDEGWKIIHEHTSSPLDDTLKAKLQR